MLTITSFSGQHVKTVKNHIRWMQRHRHNICDITVTETPDYGADVAIIADVAMHRVTATIHYADPTLARNFASFYMERAYGGFHATGLQYDVYTSYATSLAIKHGTRKYRRSILYV